MSEEELSGLVLREKALFKDESSLDELIKDEGSPEKALHKLEAFRKRIELHFFTQQRKGISPFMYQSDMSRFGDMLIETFMKTALIAENNSITHTEHARLLAFGNKCNPVNEYYAFSTDEIHIALPLAIKAYQLTPGSEKTRMQTAVRLLSYKPIHGDKFAGKKLPGYIRQLFEDTSTATLEEFAKRMSILYHIEPHNENRSQFYRIATQLDTIQTNPSFLELIDEPTLIAMKNQHKQICRLYAFQSIDKYTQHQNMYLSVTE